MSISSNVLPWVSKRKKYTVKDAVAQQAAKTYPYRKSIAEVMKGVKKARRKFQIQFEAVDIAIHCARYRDGYSSLVTVQIIGPQVLAKAAINKHAKTIMAVPALGVAVGFARSSAKCPTDEKTKKHMPEED